SLLAAHDPTSGADVSEPPSDSHASQLMPSHVRCQSALSRPRAKTSRRPAPHDTEPGSDVMLPPSDFHASQLVSSNFRCHSAPSPPRAKTSSRVAAGAAASGSEVRTPPSDCQLKEKPSTRLVSGTMTQPLSSVGVAKRVWLPMATSKRSDPLTASKP